MLERVLEEYVIENKREVLEWLGGIKGIKREMVKFLSLVPNKVREYFGNVDISLCIHRDIELNIEKLYIVIIDKDRDIEESIRLYYRFISDWFIHRDRKIIPYTGISII